MPMWHLHACVCNFFSPKVLVTHINMTTNDEITTTEAASLMGVSKKTIYRLLESGDITPSKVIVQAVREMVERKNKRRASK